MSLHSKVTPTPPTNPSKAWRTPPISPHIKHDGDNPTPRHEYTNPDSHRKHHHSSNHHSNHSSTHRPYSGSSRNALLAGLGRQEQVDSEGRDGRPPPIPPIGKSSSADGIRRDEGNSSYDVQSRKTR